MSSEDQWIRLGEIKKYFPDTWIYVYYNAAITAKRGFIKRKLIDGKYYYNLNILKEYLERFN